MKGNSVEVAEKTVTVEVEKDASSKNYNAWASNTVYTYRFKIGDLSPIVFDGVTVTDYDTQTVIYPSSTGYFEVK